MLINFCQKKDFFLLRYYYFNNNKSDDFVNLQNFCVVFFLRVWENIYYSKNKFRRSGTPNFYELTSNLKIENAENVNITVFVCRFQCAQRGFLFYYFPIWRKYLTLICIHTIMPVFHSVCVTIAPTDTCVFSPTFTPSSIYIFATIEAIRKWHFIFYI